MLDGCASAPPDLRETYVVRPEDTLYSIAWRHDIDFRDLARWNNIGPDFKLVVGQVLLLQPADQPPGQRLPAGSAAAASAGPSVGHGVGGGPTTGTVPSALAQPPTAARSQTLPRVGRPRPLAGPADSAAAQPGAAAIASNAAGGGSRAAGAGRSSTGPAAGSATAGGTAGAGRAPGGAGPWLWPTDHAAPPRPVPSGGILLFGKLGQDVRAAGAGRVVYTGSGIRGYGNLIIVKHGDNLLSSYAHNNEMLVHEGQEVSMGQTIAHMGTASHQTSALYFEIRLNGKPVDPLHYLPAAK